MYTISYDFGDTLVELGGLQFAVRLFTDHNAYAPDPDRVVISREEGRIRMKADGLSWAGNQRKAAGYLQLAIERGADGRYVVDAQGGHDGENCKSIMVEVFGIAIDSLTYDQGRTEPLGPHRCIGAKQYPGFTMKMPLVFVADKAGDNWFALSKDKLVRRKSFAAHYDPYVEAYSLDLVHEEDARHRSKTILAPTWHVGTCTDRSTIVMERCADLEQHYALVPFEQRKDVPDWLQGIKLTTILHGEHWTGHVYNTFADMEQILHWIAERMPAEEVLVFLPAWDGRYYYNYPKYEPSPFMGGAEGFGSLCRTARSLGFRIVPMLGANALNLRFAAELGLEDAVVRDRWGQQMRISWVDWDYDLTPENDSALANLGHPGFRQHMVERASRLVDDYQVDGIFLDISSYWANDPNYSPYEGTVEWADAMKSRYPDLLLFGENSYDALWGAFSLFHEGTSPAGYEYALYRYARQTHYLAYPAPGRGSGGVHEWAWANERPGANGDLPEVIPTLTFVADTLAQHARAAEYTINQAKAWKQVLPGIAGRHTQSEETV